MENNTHKELKLYKIAYGNGYIGNRSNLGKELVMAVDMKSAKKILSEYNNVKLAHIGKATRVPFLKSNTEVSHGVSRCDH